MSEYLVIRLGNSTEQLAQWLAVDSTGARKSELYSGLLAEAVAEIGHREVIVLVPSVEVLTTSQNADN
jgi:primosomal protein N'